MPVLYRKGARRQHFHSCTTQAYTYTLLLAFPIIIFICPPPSDIIRHVSIATPRRGILSSSCAHFAIAIAWRAHLTSSTIIYIVYYYFLNAILLLLIPHERNFCEFFEIAVSLIGAKNLRILNY